MLKFYNTLTKRKEGFIPLTPKKVKMYNCGPTVYDDVHIGNLRSFVFADILRRTLEFNKQKVKQIVNITDIGHLASDSDEGEDKMTKGLKREGKPITLKSMKELGNFYAERFRKDLKDLNIKKPFKMPRAGDHLKGDIKLIKNLERKGFAYKTSDGVYFDTSKDAGYGKLGGLSEEKESRIKSNSEKRNEKDFALWKFSSQDGLGFKSPWGLGFPGWHIECSAMAQKYLGKTFDIHTGGIDLAPIHHNNEIAQSENSTGKPFARYWLHNEFVNIKDSKMAKSEGNSLQLKDLKGKNIDPLAYRYWLLTAHYRSPITFSWEALEASQTALEKIKTHLQNTKSSGKISQKYLEQFKISVNDDLNTPQALAILWEVLKDDNLSDADKKKTILEMDKVFGLRLAEIKKEKIEIPKKVQELTKQREKAREEKNWGEADRLRSEIEQRGFLVKDTENGSELN